MKMKYFICRYSQISSLSFATYQSDVVKIAGWGYKRILRGRLVEGALRQRANSLVPPNTVPVEELSYCTGIEVLFPQIL